MRNRWGVDVCERRETLGWQRWLWAQKKAAWVLPRRPSLRQRCRTTPALLVSILGWAKRLSCVSRRNVSRARRQEMLASRKQRIAQLPTPMSQAPATLVASREARELRRRVWGLAGPVIGENFLETLLGI